MNIKQPLFMIVLVTMFLRVGPAFGMVNSRGFSGIDGITNGILMPKGGFSIGLHSNSYSRLYERYNYFFKDGTRFLKDAEVRTTDITLAAAFGLSKRVEIGMYLRHRIAHIDADLRASLLVPEYAEGEPNPRTSSGISYTGFGMQYLLYGDAIRQIYSSLGMMVDMPLGDDRKGLSFGKVDVDMFGTFTKRFSNFGLHVNGGYRFISKDSEWLFNSKHNKIVGQGRALLMLEYLFVQWFQMTLSFELESGLSLNYTKSASEEPPAPGQPSAAYLNHYFSQNKSRQTFALGGRFMIRGSSKSTAESMTTSSYFAAIGVTATYAIDENSEESPIGGMLSFTIGPKGDQDTLRASLSRPAEEDPSVVLVARKSDDGSARIDAMTSGVEGDDTVSYVWTTARGETFATSSPSVTVANDVEVSGMRCAVNRAGVQVAMDMLR